MASTWPELHSGTNFNYVWEVATLSWVKEVQASGSSGGPGTSVDGTHAEGAANDSTNMFTLPGLAQEAAPVLVDGTKTSLSMTLAGLLRTQAAVLDGNGNGLVTAIIDPTSGQRGLIVRNLPSGTQAVSAASLPLPTGAALEATQAAMKSGQTAGAINVVQFDEPGTLPTNHDYTTQRCGQYREGLVRLLSSNGSTLGEPGSTYPLTITFPSGSTTNTQSFTANAQTISYGLSSSDSTAKGTTVFHIQNTWVGTIEFQGRVSSGDAYTAIPVVNLATGVVGTTATVPGFYVVASSWLWSINLVTTAWTSGQADVTSAVSPEAFATVIASPLSLPTGAATAALQTTGNTSLGTIATNTTGIATAALQTSGNVSLATIAASVPSVTTLDGQVVSYTTDSLQRRISELDYIQTLMTTMNTIISSEAENSHRMGFELR